MNTCQFIVLSTIIAVSAAELQPWNGPFADHILGQLVHETPEVAAARRHHETVFAKVKSALPELPLEEDPVIQLQAITHSPVQLPHFVHHEITSAPTDLPTHTRWTGPLADHTLGQNVQETPEVAAARRHHETVFSKVKSALPELPSDNTDIHHQQVVTHPLAQLPHFAHEINPLIPTDATHSRWTGPLADHKLGQNVQETPEVAAARHLHESVFSKVKSVLPELPQEDAQVHHVVPEVRHLGVFETPEVEAARQAHFRALSEANLHLQRVNIHTFSTTTPPAVVHLNDYPLDTPEVAAAKLAHARAYAALLGH